MYHSKLKSKELDTLFEAVLSLKSEEECYMFFEDLCTVAELSAISQRYKVAQMLKDGITCHAIAEKDRRVHGDNFACEPLPQLWHGRIRRGA